MVKYIVLFKLRDDVFVEEKFVVMNSFKEVIEVLFVKIFVICKIEVGLNMNLGEIWNIVLYSEFDNLDDVKFYVIYFEYVVVGKILVEIKESWVCVDYEF